MRGRQHALQIGSDLPRVEKALTNLQETAAQRLQAWHHGLLSDNDAEWARQLAALAAYSEQHGDAHVGHRPDDDPELVRWAAKQRAASKADDLPADRRAAASDPSPLCMHVDVICPLYVLFLAGSQCEVGDSMKFLISSLLQWLQREGWGCEHHGVS